MVVSVHVFSRDYIDILNKILSSRIIMKLICSSVQPLKKVYYSLCMAIINANTRKMLNSLKARFLTAHLRHPHIWISISPSLCPKVSGAASREAGKRALAMASYLSHIRAPQCPSGHLSPPKLCLQGYGRLLCFPASPAPRCRTCTMPGPVTLSQNDKITSRCLSSEQLVDAGVVSPRSVSPLLQKARRQAAQAADFVDREAYSQDWNLSGCKDDEASGLLFQPSCSGGGNSGPRHSGLRVPPVQASLGLQPHHVSACRRSISLSSGISAAPG